MGARVVRPHREAGVEQQSPGATPLWPGPHDLAARFDRLEQRLADLEGLRPAVEGALVAQASRIESVLAAARRDLAETAVGDHVQAALARAVADGDDRLAEVRAALAASTAPVEALAGAVEDLHRTVTQVVADADEDRRAVREALVNAEAVPATVEDGLGRVVAALEEQRAAAERERQAVRDEQAEAIEHLRAATAAAVDEVRRAATEASDRVASRLDEAGARLERAVEAVGSAETAIGEHLAEAERRATVERARLTGAFVEQLADGLTRRERKRLAKRLEVPEPVVTPDAAMPTVADPQPDVARDPAPHAGPARVAPPPQTAHASLPVPGDPAAVRRALAAVRGLGPARQSALIDRFGTLEAIREASDEELLEMRGIGPSLLPGIRDAVALPD